MGFVRVRVLFWGTPEFASPALRALIGEGFEVVGVVTQPDRAQGRSRSALIAPPVKSIALLESIPVLQPERPRETGFAERIAALTPDISVVVAYGHILPTALIELPRLGTLNIHASLLPRLRGAAPIQAAIRLGERQSGVSIMRMVQALDAGPVILAHTVPIHDDETAGELALRLSELGAQALIEALTLLGLGAARETPQNEALATYAGKVEREHARVDWRAEAVVVSRQIRAYDPRPGAFTTLRGDEVKLFGARESSVGCAPAGEVLEISERGLLVACGQGAVRVLQAQPAGKRRVSAAEWHRGRGIGIGDLLGN